MRSPLAVDIETVGLDWEALHPEVQAYLLGRARSDEEREAVPHRLALHPGTGRIVAIALWRPLERRGGVLVEGEPSGWEDFEDGAKIYRGPERALLQEFWRYVAEHAGTVVTFNGRAFDAPYLMLRSALLGVAPTRNLMPYRYSLQEHCDLAEVLTFFRARPLDSLAFWCHQFGIPSPKAEASGAAVEAMYRAGDLLGIARYCLRDAQATAELYLRLQPLIAVLDGRAGEPARRGET